MRREWPWTAHVGSLSLDFSLLPCHTSKLELEPLRMSKWWLAVPHQRVLPQPSLGGLTPTHSQSGQCPFSLGPPPLEGHHSPAEGNEWC